MMLMERCLRGASTTAFEVGPLIEIGHTCCAWIQDLAAKDGNVCGDTVHRIRHDERTST